MKNLWNWPSNKLETRSWAIWRLEMSSRSHEPLLFWKVQMCFPTRL